jgi:type I restriction enzyme S subunit
MYGGAGTIGKSGVLGISAATNQAVASILPNPAAYDSDFLHFQVVHLRGQWMQFSQGNRKDPNINKSVVEDMLVWLPSLPYQKQIAARLKTQLAAVETARKAALAQAIDVEALQQAIYREAFVAFENAECVPLASIADIQLGKMLSPKAKTGNEASFLYLRNQNVQWGQFNLADLATMQFTERERAKFSLQDGDLLVCEGGEPGRCAVWRAGRTDCYYQKALHRVRPHAGKADSDFIGLWLRHQAFMGAFEDQNAKTTIAHLPLVRLAQLTVPRLPLPEQQRIVADLKQRLAALERMRTSAQAQLADLEALPARLLAQAFDSTDKEVSP